MKTSTKNVIITGVITLICSIISIIATEEYITANQEQEQTQNQSVIVNINGQEVSYESKDAINLNNQISLLESENKRLEETNSDLESQINQKNQFMK